LLEINTIHNGNCLDLIKQLDDNSVDSIVTDPPYELGFMGKKWDSTGIAYNVDVWKECLRVLKPGGYLLSFGGTRTYHRMASAIEDAGFQVRDMIQWIYGCLDEATEILTNQGWKNYREINKSYKIACFDKENEEISYCEPEEIYIYDFDGEMIRIKGRTLDQMLTPNHRVLLKEMKEKGHRENNFYETEWIFKEAKDLTPNRGIRLPLAGDYKGIKSIGLDMAELLGWIISEGTFNKNNNAIYICQTERYPQNIDRIRLLLNKLDLFDNEYVSTYPY
jgi:DNA modification methylase